MSLPSVGQLLLSQPRKRRDSRVEAMDLNTLLNTNRNGMAAGNQNMQYEVPMPLGMAHDMSHPQNYQQNLYVPNSRIKTEGGSDGRVSPHSSEHSSRYPSQAPANSIAFQQIASQLGGGMRYPSPSQGMPSGQMPLIQHSYHPNAASDTSYPQAQLGAVQHPVQEESSMDGSARVGNPLPKAFACSTCSKGFARRSDLARHERIHSGVRPHVCDHPGCGKQFIQRSALTVHSRVHTGEKPHMCERCSKPFSDSSSLARHRRIHSGKRPYKCPYADCQKTFTRRTTLTRHQNHHTGTVEESEAATAAMLASRVSLATQRSRGSDEDEGYSADGKSPMLQPPSRPSSVSPAMAGVPQLQRQTSDYYMNAMSNGMAAVPAHLRSEMQPTPRSASPAQYQMAVSQAQRPPLTSNPSSGYNPPQILEPPAATNGQHSGSANNSPHMGGAMGWQSPHNMAANGQHQDYSYADANGNYAVNPATQMYYQQQRPHSTGPMDYQNQMRAPEMWAHQQS